MTTVTVAARFNGPPASANGGWVSGIVAGLVGGHTEVTLRAPPPLETPLDVVTGPEVVELRDGEVVVATGRPAEPGGTVPGPVTVRAAAAAAEHYPLRTGHPFPTCFTCGIDRAPGDGLRIFPGPVPGRDVVAAPWTPHPSLAGSGPLTHLAAVWAALDCPAGIAVTADGTKAVLGRMTARVDGPVRIGHDHVVVGWATGRDGRKLFGGSAVYTADGALVARAESTWIAAR